MKKNIFAVLLALSMAVTPMYVMAEETAAAEETAETAEEKTEDITEETTEVTVNTDENAETAEKGGCKFSDVSTDAWYVDAVNFVTERGIMNGTSETLFSPDETATRGMTAVILNNIEGKTEKVYWAYLDVEENAWYADSVAWCSENSIINGYGNGYFGPEDEVTREQLVSILYRYAQFKNLDSLETTGVELLEYEDYADISGYAGDPMQWALKIGIISGTDGNTLSPKAVAHRAEIAQIIKNFMEFYKL